MRKIRTPRSWFPYKWSCAASLGQSHDLQGFSKLWSVQYLNSWLNCDQFSTYKSMTATNISRANRQTANCFRGTLPWTGLEVWWASRGSRSISWRSKKLENSWGFAVVFWLLMRDPALSQAVNPCKPTIFLVDHHIFMARVRSVEIDLPFLVVGEPTSKWQRETAARVTNDLFYQNGTYAAVTCGGIIRLYSQHHFVFCYKWFWWL